MNRSIFVAGCAAQIPKEVLEEAVKGPANSGATVSSDYVQEPPYMYDPSEWSVLELNVTDQKINENDAEIVSESKIQNDSFEVNQVLKQQFEKENDTWSLANTEVVDSSAKALSGVNYVPSYSGTETICLSDLPDSKVEFNEDEQSCIASYPAQENEGSWLVEPSGKMVTTMKFDGFQWGMESESFEGEYHSPFTGTSIEGRRPDTTEAAFDYLLGSSDNSDSYKITFKDITETNMSLTLSWSGTRYKQSSAEAVGGYAGLLHSGEGTTSSFDYSAQYSGKYELGLSDYGYGDEETFTLKKVKGNSSMPKKIECVFTYPDNESSTRVLQISWEGENDHHSVAFDMTPE